MNKDLTFSGITLTPYDDVSPDGQLSVLHNLENYNGSLRNMQMRGHCVQAHGKIVYVHQTSQYSHIIYMDEETDDFMYYNEADMTKGLVRRRKEGIQVEHVCINHIGNVLVFLSASRPPYYVMWDGSSYNDMGEIPELSVKFALRSTLVSEKLELFDHNSWTVNTQTDNEKMNDYNYAAACVSNFIEKQCNEKGLFVFPFFVRAAYRLADGKHIMHTPPVLMIPNSAGPYCTTAIAEQMHAFAFASKLEAIYDPIPHEWSSLITAIDIFVSEPLDPFVYDFDAANPDLVYITNLNGSTADKVYQFVNYGIGRVEEDKVAELHRANWNCPLVESFLGKGLRRSENYGFYSCAAPWVADLNNFPKHTFHLRHKLETYSPESVSAFYLVGSILVTDMDEHIVDRSHLVDMPGGYYGNLRFKERLDDDYQSHDTIMSQYGHVYNARLSVVSNRVSHFVGHDINHIFAYQDADSETSLRINIYYRVARNGRDNWYKMQGETHRLGYLKCINHMFTPSLAVKEVAFSIFDGVDTHWYRIGMKGHPLLNGQQYIHNILDDFDSVNNILVYDDVYHHLTGRDEPVTSFIFSSRFADDTEFLDNTIRTSRTNNPLSFPAEGEIVVGSNGIVGMCGITTALSTGQFGGFPLMVFCKDGNYALKVLENGWYGDVSAMKRDVCTNAESITKIDGAIIFTSARGVMIFDGNEVECISKDLTGTYDDFSEIASGGTIVQPSYVIEGCTYAWDYMNKRLICARMGCDIAYVRNMEDGLWSTMIADKPVSILNSYPHCYVQDEDYIVMKLDSGRYFVNDGDDREGLIVTRPLKLDTLQFKKLMKMALQGTFRESQEVSLYASNDLQSWHLVGNTKNRVVERMAGRWYKYVRFVIKTDLYDSESISMLRLQYDVRNESQIR